MLLVLLLLELLCQSNFVFRVFGFADFQLLDDLLRRMLHFVYRRGLLSGVWGLLAGLLAELFQNNPLFAVLGHL